MRRSRWLSLAMVLVLLASTGALVGAGPPPGRPTPGEAAFAPGRILVKFRPGVGAAQKVAAHRAQGARVLEVIPGIDVEVVSVPAGAEGAKVAAYARSPLVAYAEPDYIAQALADPDDEHFLKQWGLDNDGQVYDGQSGTVDADIDAPEAWDIATGSSDVKIAILDTGIDQDHPDLPPNKLVGNVDFTSSVSGVDDKYGHGTHVAGIAAAETNNAQGVAGVDHNARLLNVKVLNDQGSGYYSWIANGITWAADYGVENSVKVVINMSLGGKRKSTTLENAVNYAWRNGVVVVAAAGNDGNPSANYPAKYENCIAVAATDSNDQKASWSQYGDWVDVAAPGVDIYSTFPNHDFVLRDKYEKSYNYDYGSGTSMSTPFVSGLAGLLFGQDASRTNADVRTLIESTADDILGTGTYWVYGRINACKAVGGTCDGPVDTTPPAKVSGLTVSTVSWAQLDLAWGDNTETDLDHYNVYRSTTSGGLYDLIASPTTNSHLDTGLAASTTYYYVVTAVDTSGNEGEACEEASGKTSADDLGPVTSNVVADPNPTNGATSVTLTADVSDATTGNSTIEAAEFFVGTVGADGSGTLVSASDGAFDSPTEGVTASIDVSGWAVGQYTLYVHGKDAEGNWGATNSVVLDVTEAPSNIMYVEHITFSSKVAGRNKFLYTTVKVVDGSESPLGGAGVEMTLTGDTSSTRDFAGETGSDGTVVFTLRKAASGSYTATVTGLALADYTWDDTKGETSASCELEDDGTVIQ